MIGVLGHEACPYSGSDQWWLQVRQAQTDPSS